MSINKDRILFLDLLRAFAVIMMIQGHTVHTFLSEEYRTFDSFAYGFWHMIRGYTAPIFMFTSGVTFTYLLNKRKIPYKFNPRIKKGINRFILLITTGYFLRFPTLKFWNLQNVSEKQWYLFWGVDALHLIGFGILFIIICSIISEKLSFNKSSVYIYSALLFFFLAPIFKNINFIEIFPVSIASYLNYDTGSFFPLFPWAGYIFAGAILGNYLADIKGSELSVKFSQNVLITGLIIFSISILIKVLSKEYFSDYEYFRSFPGLVFNRLGIVLILVSIISYLSKKINSVPSFVFKLGRHTLLIYVIHLMILYGSVIAPGFYKFYGKSFNLVQTIFAVICMLFFMTLLAIYSDKLLNKKAKIKNYIFKFIRKPRYS